MSDKESIKLKIAALLAKAESTTNEFEAAAAKIGLHHRATGKHVKLLA